MNTAVKSCSRICIFGRHCGHPGPHSRQSRRRRLPGAACPQSKAICSQEVPLGLVLTDSGQVKFLGAPSEEAAQKAFADIVVSACDACAPRKDRHLPD